MKLNAHSSPPFHPCFRVNGRDPAWCLNMLAEEISEMEGLVEIGANMLRPEYRRKGLID